MIYQGIELLWTGHSGVFICDRAKIYIDPYKIPLGSEKADIIFITHSHYDHCSIEDLQKIIKSETVLVISSDCQSKINKIETKVRTILVEPGSEGEIFGVKFKVVPAYNVNKVFHDKSEYWNGYVLEIDGTKIYHAGDTDFIPEMMSLTDIDIAFLPVSGTYAMNADEAARAVFMIKPKISVPIHFGDVVGTREDAERFIDLCNSEGFEAKII